MVTLLSFPTLPLPLLLLLLVLQLSRVTGSVAQPNHLHRRYNSPSLEINSLDTLNNNITERSVDATSLLKSKVTDISAQKIYGLDLYAGNVSSTYNLTFSYFTNTSPFPADIEGSLSYYEDGQEDTSYSVTTLYVSANLCNLPVNDTDGTSQDHLVGTLFFDNETMQFPLSFRMGYASAKILLRNRKYVQTRSLYLTLGFDDLYRAYDPLQDYFEIQFGISSEDYIFKNQLARPGYIRFLDSDSDTVLFETRNNTYIDLSDDNMNYILQGSTNYHIKLFEKAQLTQWQYLNESVCYISTLANESENNGHGGHVTQQLNQSVSRITKVADLTPLTQYQAFYLHTNNDTDYQVLNIIQFETQQPGVCKLVAGGDMSFCSDVQYSIPQSAQFQNDGNYTALIQLYDDYAAQVYQNFTLALSLAGCHLEDDQVYSPIATCEQCAESYKQWLCSVLVPRCSSSTNTSTSTNSGNNPSTNSTGTASSVATARVERTALRNDALNELVQPVTPYVETLPCIDLCFAIVRNCPSSLGVSCPKMMRDMVGNYGFKNLANQNDGDGVNIGCNFIGDVVYPESIKTIGDTAVFGS